MSTSDRQPLEGGTSFLTSARLVAEREIVTQTRSKGFWFSFGVMVIGIFALTILPKVFGGGDPSVATVGAAAEEAVATAAVDAQPAADVAAAEAMVRSGDVDAAVVPDPGGESPIGLRVIALTDEPTEVVSALSVAPPVDLLDPAVVSEGVLFIVSFVFALVFFMLSLGFGMTIAQSVVTEKQTRIVEILVATVPVRALLAGKISGLSLLAFGQVAVLALLTPIALRIGGQEELLDMIGGALGWFVPFFVLGFVLLAGMWAVAGALVSRQEDLSSSTSLVMSLVMVPYLGVILGHDNETVMTVLSHLPFSAPVAMPIRLFSGDAQAWEPFVSLAVLVVSLVGCVLAASRLYSGSLLQTGGKVKVGQAWTHRD